MRHLIYLIFRYNFDVTGSLEELNTAEEKETKPPAKDGSGWLNIRIIRIRIRLKCKYVYPYSYSILI